MAEETKRERERKETCRSTSCCYKHMAACIRTICSGSGDNIRPTAVSMESSAGDLTIDVLRS
jgi:hypothetical protein